jgi:hypothetical protein
LEDKLVRFEADFIHPHKRQNCPYLFGPGNTVGLGGKTPEFNQRADRYIKKASRILIDLTRMLKELKDEGRRKVLMARRKIFLDLGENAADYFLGRLDLRGLTENLDVADGVKEKERIALPSLFNPTIDNGSQKKNEETKSLASR